MIDVNKKIMESLKAHNKVALETYKLLKAKILEFKTAKNAKEYTEAEEINLIRKMIDDRMNSAEIYKNNNRQDLANDELAQVDVLQALLPELPTKDDIEKYLNENYASGIEKRSMGIVIKEIKEKMVGVDGKLVADCVKNKLI